MICHKLTIMITSLLIISSLNDIKEININYSMFNPRLYQERREVKTFQKLIFEDFVENVNQVNFQLLSNLYVRKGKLSENDLFNLANYQKQIQGFQCKLYKTDLRMPQYPETSYVSPPDTALVIEYDVAQKNGQFASIYVSHDNNKISVTEVFLGQEQSQKKINNIDMTQKSFRLQQNPQVITVLTTKQDQINLIKIKNVPYIITRSRMIRYNKGTKIQSQVAGFTNPLLSPILSVQVFELNSKYMMYTMTAKQIRIFQLVTDLNVTLIRTITQLKNSSLLTSIYENGLIYATALNKLFIINITDINNQQIFSTPINGSCNYIDKFQTTLHLGCVYDKLYYIAQFYTTKTQIFLNRFYANQDIEGRALVRRIGMGKMAIVTDNDIRITNYGFNRNTLLQYGSSQPQFIFNVKYAVDIIPINVASSNKVTTVAVICNDKLVVAKIIQTPPELSCTYPVDTVGAQYQILMQFNTSRCSYVSEEKDLSYGNIQSVCQVMVPILVVSKQKVYKKDQTNLIQFFFVVVIIFFVLLILACAIKYNHVLQVTFKNVQQQLEKKLSRSQNKNSAI